MWVPWRRRKEPATLEPTPKQEQDGPGFYRINGRVWWGSSRASAEAVCSIYEFRKKKIAELRKKLAQEKERLYDMAYDAEYMRDREPDHTFRLETIHLDGNTYQIGADFGSAAVFLWKGTLAGRRFMWKLKINDVKQHTLRTFPLIANREIAFLGIKHNGSELSGDLMLTETDHFRRHAKFSGCGRLTVKVDTTDHVRDREREAKMCEPTASKKPRYELPKFLEVGTMYRTKHCVEPQETDFRILAITAIAKDDRRAIRQNIFHTNNPEHVSVERFIIVYERTDADGRHYTNTAKNYGDFMDTLYQLCPSEYTVPDVDAMVKSLLSRHDTGCLPNETLDDTLSAIFASPKAYKAIMVNRYQGRSHDGETILTYSKFPVYEVPNVNGYKVWLGRE